MSTTVTPGGVRDGVDTERLFATLDAVGAQPEIAAFQFRARNRWIGGAHNRSVIKDLRGAGGEDTSRPEAFVLDAGAFMQPLSANRAYEFIGRVALGAQAVLL